MALLPSILLFLSVSLVTLQVALSGDADILQDFIPPSNTTIPPDGSFFTYTGLRATTDPNMPPDFKVFKASMAEFPALNGQSVSFAVLVYPPGTVNPPHTHPRASELLFLLEGSLEVGFVTTSTSSKLFNQTLQEGDIFVFPKGLMHFQYNRDENTPAVAVSAFGSASAGTVSIPSAVFNTSIYDPVLAASFKTDIVTIRRLKYGLSH